MLKSDVHAFNLKGSYLAVKFVFQLISYSVVRFLGKARSKAHVVVVINNNCKGNNYDTYRSLLNYDVHAFNLKGTYCSS